MFRKALLYIVFVSLSGILFSCSNYRKIQKSQDFQYKYQKALEYYDREDYFRAMNLFDQVLPFFRGTEEAEKIAYKYSYAYYYQKEYLMASYHFNRFAKTYPRNEKAQECAFMSAYCKYKESPNYKLDQTNTYDAIKELQIFLNVYPYSDSLDACNRLIDELRAKLQRKDFEIAKLYLKMEKYISSITAFENLLKQYPDTKLREDAMFYTIKAHYFYAHKSVRAKREERYQQAVDIYQEFKRLYPESKYNKDIEYMVNRVNKDLKKLN
jgi:outer membrane protein assembly factor BamD